MILLSDAKVAEQSNTKANTTYVLVSGKVMQIGVPIVCKVRLFDRNSLSLIRSTMSSPDGSYEFSGVEKNKSYLVSALHPQKQFNAVIQDNVVPK